MKSAAWRYAALVVLGCSLAVPSRGADVVTDADRVWTNFTREAATVGEGKIRLEVRGATLENEKDPELTLAGVPVEKFQNLRDICTGDSLPCTAPNDFELDRVQGGVIDLLASYGIWGAEIGLNLPLYIQKSRFLEATNGMRNDPEVAHTINDTDVGDLLFYGKYRLQVAEGCAVAGGMEVTAPTGVEESGFGTGDASFNPFASTRYQRGRFAVGGHLGYQIYAGDAANVFNWGVETILRGNHFFALRVEVAGRYLDDYGQTLNDIVVVPGFDVNLSENITLRPMGLAGLKRESVDWGLGFGFAVTL